MPKLTLLEQDPRVGSDSPLPWKGGAGNQAELNILEDAVQCLTSCFPPEVKLAVCVCSVALSCLILCDSGPCQAPRDFPGRVLEWIAMASSRGSSQPRDGT